MDSHDKLAKEVLHNSPKDPVALPQTMGIERSTEKAVLVFFERPGQEQPATFWFPKSQMGVRTQGEDRDPEHWVGFTVSQWLIAKNDLWWAVS